MKTILLSLLIYLDIFLAMEQGDSCTMMLDDEEGVCVQYRSCDFALSRFRKFGDNPQTCGFLYNEPLVCCPKRNGFVSTQMCFKYHDVRRQVHATFAGVQSAPHEFPHMAAVGFGQQKMWLCGGTLISHSFVLSAAHCASSEDLGPATWIRLGDLDLKNTTEDAHPIDMKITQIFVHPKYKNPSFYHDIALFKMETDVNFNGLDIEPACLHVKRAIPIETLWAIGWGKVNITSEGSSHLMKVDLKIVDNRSCKKKYKDVSRRRLQTGILEKFQICAGDKSGKDTCPGDSGGPLHYRDNKYGRMVPHYIVAGITSFGKGCGGSNSAGVYTRVSSYVNWIESIVWPQPYI